MALMPEAEGLISVLPAGSQRVTHTVPISGRVLHPSHYSSPTPNSQYVSHMGHFLRHRTEGHAAG